MDPNAKPAKRLPDWVRWPRGRFWLQLSACAVVGWSLLHGSVEIAPPPDTAASPPAATAAPAAAAPAVALASVSPLADAQAALSRIDIVVARNDTLERIFRRLKLDLSDLASMRSLPGVRDALDSLRPGDALRVTHKDGSLYGLERRLNETQTLRVSRDPTLGLKADVLQNPLETRTRTVQG